MPSNLNPSIRGRPPTKKALLIGISYHNGRGRNGQTLSPIPTSIPNVNKFKALLQESWGYTDIKVMTDEPGVGEKLRPTKENLKREIKALRRGVKRGDHRVFYFAGHSEQMPCKTGSEEDGQDEFLVTLYGYRIRDNTLYNWLVKDLPKGSKLTAIFDSCTSGTMLDLGHYKCNGVYYPWMNKGRRGSKTLQNIVVRKNGRITRSGALSLPRSRMGSGEGNFQSPGIFQVIRTEESSILSFTEDTDKHDGQRCASPERQWECEGWCHGENGEMERKGSLPHADVVSISSSNDGQTSWDASTRSGDSISMTNSLIKVLREHPQITYQGLMTLLNHEVHSFTMKMHKAVQRESRARHRAGGKLTDSDDTEPEEDKGEMDNFQDLQLGSITPLDMNRVFMF